MSTIISVCGNNFCTFVSDGRKVQFDENGKYSKTVDDNFRKIFKLNDNLIYGTAGIIPITETLLAPFREYPDVSVLTMPLALKAIQRYYRDTLIPGFVFQAIYRFLNSKQKTSETFFILWSVAISYVIVTIVKSVLALFNKEFVVLWFICFICVVVAIISALAVTYLSNSSLFAKFLRKISTKSVNDSIWRNVIDFEHGTIATVRLKSGLNYVGDVYDIEERGNESWMSLRNPIQFEDGVDGEKVLNNDDRECVVAFCLADVASMTLLHKREHNFLNK